jgi:gas vesicle protein
MATTVRPRPRTGGPARASARETSRDESREQQFDLLTATLIGVALGVGTTLLLRQGPRGERPLMPILRAAGKGAKWAGVTGYEGAKIGAKAGRRGASWVADKGEDLWDRVPAEEIGESIGEFLEEARDRISETVESEMKDLRKAIKRQRRKLGV